MSENFTLSLFLISIFIPLIALFVTNFNLRWELASGLSLIGLISTLLGLANALANPGMILKSTLFLFDHLSVSMLVLIQLIAYVVLGYAKSNFENDESNQRFLFWLMLTVFSVMFTVSSNHLIGFWLGWVLISLSMHQLLTFYPERYRAVLAAHKKFIFARIAETLLAIAFCLLAYHHKTFYVSDILSQYPNSNMDWDIQAATILIAIVAVIKCAQLPMHGWLIQVVESPTPVSAILHAGIINLGGFLILRFAVLVDHSIIARILILLISGITMVLAALIMMTRVSIKVRLAWSTLSQMGLMLVECALGLYGIAFLHIVAHSFYKAHAFLTAGEVVKFYKEDLHTPLKTTSLSTWVIFTFLTALILIPSITLLGMTTPFSPWMLIGLALSCTFAFQGNNQSRFIMLISALLMVSSYSILKSTAGHWINIDRSTYLFLGDLWVASLLIFLFLVYLVINLYPGRPLTLRTFRLLNAGFYLDEWSTKITLRLWPISIPKRTNITNHTKEQP